MFHWLMTVLARLTNRDTSGARPQVGWNGRPLVAATEGKLSLDSPAPATGYSTLCSFVPPDRSERTRGIEAPGSAGAGEVATAEDPWGAPGATSQPTCE
jgi:hypothetical protein